MKKVSLLLFSFVVLCAGCSKDSTEDSIDTNTQNDYFYVKVNGAQATINPNDTNKFKTQKSKNKSIIYLTATHYAYGLGGTINEFYTLDMIFTKEGRLIKAKQEFHGNRYGDVYYYNYRNFSSNYFNIDILSIDESSKKIKIKIKGKLFMDGNDLNSESIEIEADANIPYFDQDETNENYIISKGYLFDYSVEQYCSAKFNTTSWIARNEFAYSSFTSEDSYKIETHFDSSAMSGNYAFNSTSTDNYVKFSKFNTSTLTYDYYNVTGIVAYSYRKYHGTSNIGVNMYSFIGTFDFIAVNPNNPSDIIHVTDGKFRSYQENKI